MDSIPAAPAGPVSSTSSPSVFERAVLVFTSPGKAWEGLRERSQWWFPMLVVALVSALSAAILHNRAIVPMVVEGWEQAVQNGNMTADQMAEMERFFTGPAGLAMSAIQQFIFGALITFIMALAVYFGVGFVLGTKLKYRLSLEVAAWSALVTLPNLVLATALGWFRETMRGVHTGFGILLPESDPPSKLMTALGVVLDALGPLSLWYLVVAVLGASALSGAPRRSVAWTLGILYLVMVLFGAGLASLMAPAS